MLTSALLRVSGSLIASIVSRLKFRLTRNHEPLHTAAAKALLQQNPLKQWAGFFAFPFPPFPPPPSYAARYPATFPNEEWTEGGVKIT